VPHHGELDGMDVKGAVVVCLNDQDAINPSGDFAVAAQRVEQGGGSGLIFAQYTTDTISLTVDYCSGIACVIVDPYVSRRICQYARDSRYTNPTTRTLRKISFEKLKRNGLGEPLELLLFLQQAALHGQRSNRPAPSRARTCWPLKWRHSPPEARRLITRTSSSLT
jgi:hypothetical protein